MSSIFTPNPNEPHILTRLRILEGWSDKTIDGVRYNPKDGSNYINDNIIHYTETTSSATDNLKLASIPQYELHIGSKFTIKLINGHDANIGNIMFNINNTGSKYAMTKSGYLNKKIEPNSLFTCIYTGVYYEVVSDEVPRIAEGSDTPRQLEERLGDCVNVKDFGAVGDGVTNDTKAFDKAKNYMKSFQQQVALYIPKGLYIIDSDPEVPCYGPGKIKAGNKTYFPYEMFFTRNGGIERDSKGRFYTDFNNVSASDKTINILTPIIEPNKGIDINENGRMIVNFQSMSNEDLKKLIEQIIKEMGGLEVDDEGHIYINWEGGIPIGSIMQWPHSSEFPYADSWLECNGQSIDPFKYPKLYELVGMRVPDYRGLFFRCNGGNAAALGVVQSYSMMSITGGSGRMKYQAVGESNYGSFWESSSGNKNYNGGGGGPTGRLYMDSSRQVPGGNEVRPMNIAVRIFMRAK